MITSISYGSQVTDPKAIESGHFIEEQSIGRVNLDVIDIGLLVNISKGFIKKSLLK